MSSSSEAMDPEFPVEFRGIIISFYFAELSFPLIRVDIIFFISRNYHILYFAELSFSLFRGIIISFYFAELSFPLFRGIIIFFFISRNYPILYFAELSFPFISRGYLLFNFAELYFSFFRFRVWIKGIFYTFWICTGINKILF